jgi:small GTP-binding protein
MKPRIVVIGGREVGKTSTIQMTWADEIVNYSQLDNNLMSYEIREMIPGREIVDYEIIELPRIRYTYDDPKVPNEIQNKYLSTADSIVILCPVNDLSINNHASYIYQLLSNVELKNNVIISIGLTKGDIILTPIAALNSEIDKEEKIEFFNVSSILSKALQTHTYFANFNDFDKTFSAESIIPFSVALQWNLNLLKYHVWNGVVLNMNDCVFDDNLPTIVLAGKTGCGKTSTINKLWNKELAVDRAVSCTKFPAVMHIADVFEGKTIHFNLVDLPGIAESVEANSIYRNFYYKYIKKADLLICLTQADRRAYKQDELFYNELISNEILSQNQKIILGINQADLLFKTKENPNGIDMKTITTDNAIVKEKIQDLFDGIFKDVFADFKNVTVDSVAIYSVLKEWNINELKNKIYKLIN